MHKPRLTPSAERPPARTPVPASRLAQPGLRPWLGRVCLLLILLLPLLAALPAAADPIRHFAYVARAREAIRHPGFLARPAFAGAQVMYAWRQLEPAPGHYDFSEIEADLKFLASHGKTLFIQLQDASFTPQFRATPQDMDANPAYGGGSVPQYNEQTGAVVGWVARRWDPAVQVRFAKLLCALGQRFDGRIAGLNLQESAVEITHPDKPVPADFTPAIYRDALLSNMQALKACFRRSLVMQYANFMPGEWLPHEDQGYLASVYAYAESAGIAVGAPDLMPEQRGMLAHAYHFMHRGQNVFGVAVQDGNYFGATGDPEIPAQTRDRIPDLYRYAAEHLRVQYLFWVMQEPFFSRDLLPFLNGLDPNPKGLHSPAPALVMPSLLSQIRLHVWVHAGVCDLVRLEPFRLFGLK